MITKNEVFNRIAEKLRGKYEDIYIVGERVYAPKKFPCVWLVEIEDVPSERYATLSLSDSQRVSTFEVQVFSNKSTGATTETYEISQDIREYFRQIGYRCLTSQPFDNGIDANIKRHVSRFTRIIGGGETLPE